MKIHLLSLFPDYFKGPFDESIIGRARKSGLLQIEHVNIRDFALDKRGTVDDRPFGGGAGMVLKAEPVLAAIGSVRREGSHVVYLTPRGKLLTDATCRRLAKSDHLVLLSGHYEGIDERVLSEVDEELSIGDYVLTNGCVAAVVVVDSVARFVPGVLGDSTSAESDSFSNGLLEHGHYTRPLSVLGRSVPEELVSGDHALIANWRRKDACQKTFTARPDLYVRYLGEAEREERPALILEVSVLAKSIRFYRKVFGLSLVHEEENKAVFSLGGGGRLVLVVGREPLSSSSALYQMVEYSEEVFAKRKERLVREAACFEASDEKTVYCCDIDGHLWMVYLYKG